MASPGLRNPVLVLTACTVKQIPSAVSTDQPTEGDSTSALLITDVKGRFGISQLVFLSLRSDQRFTLIARSSRSIELNCPASAVHIISIHWDGWCRCYHSLWCELRTDSIEKKAMSEMVIVLAYETYLPSDSNVFCPSPTLRYQGSVDRGMSVKR